MRPTAGVPIPEGNWYPVVVEVVDLVPGSIPERVQYANMEDWRMDGLQACLSLYYVSNDCTNDVKGLEPKYKRSGCKGQWV